MGAPDLPDGRPRGAHQGRGEGRKSRTREEVKKDRNPMFPICSFRKRRNERNPFFPMLISLKMELKRLRERISLSEMR